ncbi:MAG: FecR family protein [Bacteroidetes bacterium]|nr:FecR family protein [Bacteroidota bacterium]
MRLFKKYLFGFTTPEEEKNLFDNPKISKALIDAWENYDDIRSEIAKPDSDKIFQNILGKTDIPVSEIKDKAQNRYLIISFAALFIVMVISAIFLYKQYAPSDTITIYTLKGQKKDLTLPDGTRVWLNSESRVSFQREFIKNTREIIISGEAYFNVIKDSAHPFIVKTGNLTIKVTGTVFNVRSYPGDSTIETTLVSGSVIIDNDQMNKPLKLRPKEKALFSAETNAISISKVNPDKCISWKNGKLLLDNEPLPLVLEKLERWFGLEIIYSNDIAVPDERITITITDENIEEVIRLLQLATPVTFTVKDPEGTFTKIYNP